MCRRTSVEEEAHALREQLAQATQANEMLSADLERNSAEWKRTCAELEERQVSLLLFLSFFSLHV